MNALGLTKNVPDISGRARPAAAAFRAATVLGMLILLGGAGCGTLFSPRSGVDQRAAAFFAHVRPVGGDVTRLLQNAHYFQLMVRPDWARQALEEAWQQAPQDLQVADALARNYEEAGRFEQARKVYQEALNRNPQHPALHNNLCFSYYLAGKFDQAEACFREALAKDPRNRAARNNLGLLWCRLGRQEDARRLWREAEGEAAAAHKVEEALAALGISGPPTYAMALPPASSPSATPAKSPKEADRKAAARGTAAPVSESATPALPPQKAPAPPVQVAARAEAPRPPNPAAPDPSKDEPARVETSQGAPREASSRAVALPPPPSPQILLSRAELLGTAIEVRNGTRTRNLAHHTRSLLSREGFTVAKIGNHIDFGADHTVIYHRPGAERVARALSRQFFTMAALQTSEKLRPGVDVKVLLGHDLLKRPQHMARMAEGEGAAAHQVAEAPAALGMSGSSTYAMPPPASSPSATPAKSPKEADRKAAGKGTAAPVSESATPALPPQKAPAPPVQAAARAEAPRPPNPAAPDPSKDEPARVETSQGAPREASSRAGALPPPPSPQIFLSRAELLGTAIEVRNGTRTHDLAHHTRSLLSREGFTVAKIGNHIDFGADHTVIYHRPGAERVARALSRQFFTMAALQTSEKLRPGVDVKVLLGHDLLKRPQLMARITEEGE